MSLLRQSGLFVAIGVAQLMLDWCVFVAISAAGVPVLPANLIGRLSGAVLGYWLNGRYTFGAASRKTHRGALLLRYCLAWCALTALSSWALASVATWVGLQWAWVAKPLVEGLLAVLSFFVWRQLVFR